MQHKRIPDADHYRRREAFLDLIARAHLAPPAQRAHFLADAATIASLHFQTTGTPLVSDPASRLRLVDEADPPR